MSFTAIVLRLQLSVKGSAGVVSRNPQRARVPGMKKKSGLVGWPGSVATELRCAVEYAAVPIDGARDVACVVSAFAK